MSRPSPLVEIVGTGRYLPTSVVTNDDLSKRMDTTDEWIASRTGIRARHIACDGESAAHMGASAARRAMERANVDPDDVDILVLSTATPDRWLPSTACDVQMTLGCNRAMAFDLMAACSGFLYGLAMAEGYLVAGRGDVALVVSTEKMSSIVDWHDRSTCVLFGDGAGAAVVKRANGSGRGIVSSYLRSDGNLAKLLYRPAGGTRIPMSQAVLNDRSHLVHMEGREVFKSAVRSMTDAANSAMQEAGITAADIDVMVPHQANIRIIEAVARYTGIPMDRVVVNLDRYGNMSSASIPVALDESIESGLIGDGATVLTATFGAGLTWGSQVWHF